MNVCTNGNATMTRLFWYTYICNIIYTSHALHPNDAHSEGYRVSTRSGFPLSDSIDQYLKDNRPSDVEYARKKSDIISEYVNYVQRQDKGISRSIDKTVQKQESESLDEDEKVYTMVNKMIRSRGKMIRNLNTPIKTILSRKVGRGLVTCDLGGSATSHPWNHRPSSTHEPSDANVRISFDISGVMRLVPIISYVVSSSSAAFMGTLRLLAPLVVFRRALCVLGNLISDWYTGRTLRKTYTRLERIYIHYYETPALFRALTRSFSQWCVYLVLARLMGWCIGLTHPPCRSQGRGLAFLCGLIWIGAVVGTGHAFATAVSLWGGPLRLQAATHPERSSVFGIFTNPWNILQWMQNPEQWIKLIAIPERRRFVPNPIIFPATWLPLHLLQMVAVAMVRIQIPFNMIVNCRIIRSFFNIWFLKGCSN